MCPLLKPSIIEADKYIYFEGDDLNCIYLLKSGPGGFVLPKHSNMKFLDILEGNTFGVADIVGSMIKHENIDQNHWLHRKDLMSRQFTTMAEDDCEILSLSVNDL